MLCILLACWECKVFLLRWILMGTHQQPPVLLCLYTLLFFAWELGWLSAQAGWAQVGETPPPPALPVILHQVEVLKERTLTLSSRWTLSEHGISPLIPFHPPRFSKCSVHFFFFHSICLLSAISWRGLNTLIHPKIESSHFLSSKGTFWMRP